MEANSILNSFVVAANQYAASQTEQNLLHLQRQLDIVLGYCSPEQEFLNDPNQLFVTEFFTALVNILLDAEIKPALIQRVLSLLQNLIKNEAAQQALRSMFHLHSAISIFLQNHGISLKDPLVIQCLQLLEVVTYGVCITFVESNMENLINSLVKMLESKSDEVVSPIIRILANICRRNTLVQVHVCGVPNVYKFLVQKVCCSNPVIVIHALSIVSSLSANSDIGDKVFNGRQMGKTFQLIVSLLVSNEHNAQNAAFDLFFDLIGRPKAPQYFSRHADLHSTFQKILNYCSTANLCQKQIGQYLKFLLCFMEITECQKIVLSVLCNEFNDGKGDYNYETCIHPLLLKCAKTPVDTGGNAPAVALQLIKNIIELVPHDRYQQIDGSVKDLLEFLISQMSTNLNFDCTLVMHQLQRDIAVFDIIFGMCQDSSHMDFICNHLDIDVCHAIVNMQLEKNPLTPKEYEWSEAGVDLVLLIIGIIIYVKDYHGNAKVILNSLLKESRLMPFIATSLGSINKERVLRALHILFMCAKIEEFPTQMLGESIAATNNGHGMQKPGISDSFVSYSDMESSQYSSVFPANKDSLVYSRRMSIEKNVENLIQRVETGMDLRELKSSEIMEMYEHKIAALCLKEQELQNFVEAKSVALQQADRLLNQYKCRQAQREAEALKLRSLLKESERRSERAQEASNAAVHKQLKLQKDLDKAQQTINNLERYCDELKEALAEQAEKCAALQKNLENLQIEHQSVTEMHSLLQRHSETQKQKLDMITQHMADVEKEKNSLVKQLKEKDTKSKDLGKQLQKVEETLKKKEQNILCLEDSKEVLTKDVQRADKRITKLEQEKSSLELLCQQHEASLEDKENRIKSLLQELERQTHLTDMIHEITSGKISKSNFAALLNKEK